MGSGLSVPPPGRQRGTHCERFLSVARCEAGAQSVCCLSETVRMIELQYETIMGGQREAEAWCYEVNLNAGFGGVSASSVIPE